MLSKYEESAINVNKIETIVGKLMGELGTGGFMGIGDARPGMKVILIAKNGSSSFTAHGEVTESLDGGITARLHVPSGSSIDTRNRNFTYELQISVTNALYIWEMLRSPRCVVSRPICIRLQLQPTRRLLTGVNILVCRSLTNVRSR